MRNKGEFWGIINVTPDSFSDGGVNYQLAPALEHALAFIDGGCDVIDIGGESTRPGALEVPAAEEIRRVVPLIRAILEQRPGAVISVDTRKGEVARAALAAGAKIINDVSGLVFDPALGPLAAEQKCQLVIMHSSNLPENMQNPENLRSGEIFDEVVDFLRRQSDYAQGCGVAPERIIWDPGIGFGKSTEQNLELIRRAADLKKYGYKILYGVSRKSFIGKLLNIPDPVKRMAGSVGVALQLLDCGVEAVRIHDYFETRQAWEMFSLSRRG